MTKYEYNAQGYVIKETDTLNNSESFTYDYVGNIKTSINRNGAQTTNIYGPYGVIESSITDGTNTEKYTYEYDALGRLKTAKLYNNDVLKDTVSSEYDVFGRKTAETSDGYTNVYEYDNNSAVTNYKLKEGSTVKQNINYVYNSMNRLTEQMIDDTIISYGYDFNGNLTEKVTGSLRTDISYNSFNEPVAYTNRFEETVLNAYTYIYNSAGNRLTETDTANNIHKVYEYDNADRLIKEAISGATEKSSTYIYDSNGNRMTEVTELAAEATDESENYSYNLQNQLVGYTRGDTTVSYEYGANGLRKSKTVNGVTTGYVWNGTNLAAETDGETITSIYSYGVDGITLKTTGETESYYLKNAHGDVTGMANSGGTITAEYVYDSFGNILTATPNDTNPFGYCGEYQDLCSGLIYLRNRYYDPSTGRFITEDPARDGLNWYVYCDNNPIMFVDPTGMIKEGDEKLNESIQIILNGTKKDGLGGLSLAWSLADTDAERNAIAEMADKIRGFNANNINRHMVLINTAGAKGAGHTATLLLNENDQGLLFSYYSESGGANGRGQTRIAFLNSTEWNNLLYNNQSTELIANNGTIQSESYNGNLYLTVSPSNGKKGLSKIGNIYNSPGEYNLATHNCDHMTNSIATAAGIFYDKRVLPNDSFTYTQMYHTSYWLWMLDTALKTPY